MKPIALRQHAAHQHRGWGAVIAALSAWLLLAVPAASATVQIEGIEFAATYPQEQPELQLRGGAVKRYMGMFELFAAALYSPAGTPTSHILSTATPKRLEIAYLRDFSAEQLVEATESVLKKQHPRGISSSLRQEIQQLFKAMRSVEEGDRYALTYFPQQGLQLELNGNELFRSQQPEFSALYFGIWLARDPLSDSLREALLNQKAVF